MKRKIKCLLIVFSSLLIMIGGYSYSAFAWSLKEATEPWRGKTLRMIGESLPPLQALEEVKKEFEKITGVKVIIEMYGHEEVVERTTTDLVGKTGIYDLLDNPHRELGRYVELGWIQPLDKFVNETKLRDPNLDLEKGFINRKWLYETCFYKGKQYGLPFHQISMYLWYRFDLLENPQERMVFKAKYGYELPSPPINWKELRDVAEFFTRKKGETLAGKILDHDFYGFSITGKRHVATWYSFLNLLYSFGGRVIDQPRGDTKGPVILDSPEAIEALKYYVDILKYCPPGTLTYGWDEEQAAMQQGLVAMGINWDDATWAVCDPEQSVVAGKVAFSGVPIGKEKIAQIEGWTYMIPSTSRKPELAWLFIQWVMHPEVQIAQQLRGGESAIDAVYYDPRIRKLPYVPTAYYLKSGKVIKVRHVGDPDPGGVPARYLEAINPRTGNTEVTRVPKPTFPEQEPITDIIKLHVNQALRGVMTPKEAIDKMAQEIRSIMKQ
ncbi:sugar ABC transporter substrate-binding protein [Candidatus Aerophobetes bacterium]|nr:sugar ABC transporter substrate-binding protein [Candidatus Aerophobetes bacterium]